MDVFSSPKYSDRFEPAPYSFFWKHNINTLTARFIQDHVVPASGWDLDEAGEMCENCEEVKHVKFPNICKTPEEMYEKLEVEHHSLIPILNFHNDQTPNPWPRLRPSRPLHLECSSLHPVEQHSPPWVSYTPLAVNAARTATADVSVR